MKLIGLNGYKRSGKNTTAEIIQDHYDGVVYQLGFADKVKITGARALGFVDLPPRECITLMDEAKESWWIDGGTEDTDTVAGELMFSLTGRGYLQHIGTEMRKLFGADFWVDEVLPRPCGSATFTDELRVAVDEDALSARYPDIDLVAFYDLRFENEAERVLALGGEVWRVNRPGCESDGHDSEQVLPDHLVTRELHNTSDIENLSSQVYAALDS